MERLRSAESNAERLVDPKTKKELGKAAKSAADFSYDKPVEAGRGEPAGAKEDEVEEIMQSIYAKVDGEGARGGGVKNAAKESKVMAPVENGENGRRDVEPKQGRDSLGGGVNIGELVPDIGSLTEYYAERVVYTDEKGEEYRFALNPYFLVNNALKSPDDMRVAGIALQHMATKWQNDERNSSRRAYSDGSESGWEDATRVDSNSGNLLSKWAKNYFGGDQDNSDSAPTMEPDDLLKKYGERSNREGDQAENPFDIINSGQYLSDPATMKRLGKELSHMGKRWGEDLGGGSSENIEQTEQVEQSENEKTEQAKGESVGQPEQSGQAEFEPKSAEEMLDYIFSVLGPEKVERSYFSKAERLAELGESITSRSLKEIKSEFEKSFSNYQVGRAPEYVARSKATLQSVKENYNNLVQKGLVSKDVAKAWLQQDRIQDQTSLYSEYNAMQFAEVLEGDSVVSSEKWDDKKMKYREAAFLLAQKHPNAFWQGNPWEERAMVKDSNQWSIWDFIHINADKNDGKIDLRCYIAPDFARDPAVVLDAWQGALEDTELQDTLYFKIMGGLGNPESQRLDSIVVYKSPSISDEAFRNCLETFRERCRQSDPKALPDDPSKLPPTTQKIAPGIAVAPEPNFLNEVLGLSAEKSSGDHFRRHSWTTFVDRMIIVSMQLAANRLHANHRQTVDKDAMYSEAKKCFRELMLMSKINPDTMLPVEYDDNRPGWMNLS